MKLTDLFIKRPILAGVVNLIIVIAGVQAIWSVTVRQYPETQNASITINTAYIGADAELVRGFITVPIERAIAAADGIDYIQSSSQRSLSTVTARLKLNQDATRALAEISSKVDQVRGDLPPESEVPVINIETADSQFASAYLSFTSDILQQNEITDYLQRSIQPRLAALAGVQRADILGARNFAMRIWMQPDKMAALNISPLQVRRALAANNYLSAIGQTKGAMVQVNLSTNTDLQSVEEFENLVIRESGGALVRLKDVAKVALGAEDYSTEVRFSGQTATFMGIWVLPDANAIDVIAAVTEEMERIQRDLPRGLEGRVAYDATEYINNAIDEVVSTLMDTLIIVVIVIFLFLGSLRAILVPVITIPLSLIGAIFLIQIFGFTINLLTLLAIVLSVGLVVDDAIIILENVERNMRKGHTRFDAALIGARELLGPVIATTITLVAVYAPIGLQGGLTGTLFREFAFTLAGAIVISTIVAITLSPWMSSILLYADLEKRWMPRNINAGFSRLRNIYGAVLDFTLKFRPGIVLIWIVGSVLAVVMYRMSVEELAPTEDQGVVFGIVNTPANSTLEYTSAAAAAANEAFFAPKETQFSFQITFPGGGFGGAVMTPWDQRERTIFEIKPDIDAGVFSLPSVEMFPVLPPALPGGTNFPVEFVIASTAESSEILQFAEELRNAAVQEGILYFGIIDTKIDQPFTEIKLNRDKVASMGMNLQDVGADLASMIGGNFVNRFNIDGYSYKVIPQIERIERLNPAQLAQIYISGPNNELIPLSTIADFEESVQPRSLQRMQQLNAVTISGQGVPLGQALTWLENKAEEILPNGYRVDYLGESRQLRKPSVPFWVTLTFAALLIYLVLAAQYNSLRDPLIIIFGSAPLALFGATTFSFLKMPVADVPFWTDDWTTSVNIYTQVGFVTLIGLVAKNGILIVEFANVLQRTEKLSKLDAVRQAARVRLRPVLMTTAATVFGHFPLILVTGAGAEARNSIGLVVVSGMTIGTFFTLFVVPTIYTLIAKDHSKVDQRIQESKVLVEEAESVEGAGI
jgi:multidrug efflux pump